MSENRDVARNLLVDAGKTILQDRPGIHGSAENSFQMIADYWTVHARHLRKVRGHDNFQPEDVAEMMTMLKKARKVYGASTNADNDVDDIGYAALAGMLRLPDPAKDKEEERQEDLAKGIADASFQQPPSKIDTRGIAERAADVDKDAFAFKLDGTPLTEAEAISLDAGTKLYSTREEAAAARMGWNKPGQADA